MKNVQPEVVNLNFRCS